jgi:hypothetical protein
VTDAFELTDEERALLVARRERLAAEAVEAEKAAKLQRVCHYTARTWLREDGSIGALCKCGRVFENVKCPHPQQAMRGRNVICAWCNGVIIGNTGTPRKPAESEDELLNVNVNQWNGTV